MEKETLQMLPKELFLCIKEKYKFGKDFLIENDIPNALTPTWIHPIKLYGQKMAIGLYVDHYTTTFYLFDVAMPHQEKNRCSIIYQLQGGWMEGLQNKQRYINVLLPMQSRKKLNVEKNYALAMSVIYGELGKLIASQKYFSEEEVPKKAIKKLDLINRDLFETVINLRVKEPICY